MAVFAMPLTQSRRYELLRMLDEEYQRLAAFHYKEAPKGTLPVGGGDWMGSFFKMETVRGVMTALRSGKGVQDSIEEGKMVGEVAIRIWNSRSHYHTNRWDKCCHEFIEQLVYRLLRHK